MGLGQRIETRRLNPEGKMRGREVWSAGSGYRNDGLRLVLGALIIIFICGLIFAPARLLEILMACISICVFGMAGLRIFAVLNPHRNPQYRDPNMWPYYTVLVPLYNEAHMVKGLMQALSKLDYPQKRLQILMITEAKDPDTVEAVNENLRAPFRNIVVRPSLPQTKPKALNVAMGYAKGDIVTIYDAEDQPDPQQLKTAARTLIANPKLGAVQAPLDYFNAGQNWLTRQFALEYAALFHVWNPFMAWLGLPFPLGGTSNHMRRSALDSVGGWDPHNVTEDADLSFRLSAYGWHIGSIGHSTLEEAVSDYPNWQAQRERWQKGFLQSWQVHMRDIRPGGWRRFITLQITLGFTLMAAFLHVPAVIICILLIGLKFSGVISYAPGPAFLSVLGLGYLSAIACGVMGAIRAGRNDLIIHSLMMPLYWLLLFWPALRSVYQLIKTPYHWNKTRHGDTRLEDS